MKIKQAVLFNISVFLLLSGLLISGIGETFCRYILGYEESVYFEVKSAGNYYVQSDNSWEYDGSQNVHSLQFDVTNSISKTVPENDHSFYLRWYSTAEAEVALVVIESSGKEARYSGTLIQSDEIYSQYRFYDQAGYEAVMELAGNQVSKKAFRIEVTNPDDDFLSRVVLLDAGYDVEVNEGWMYANAIPLSIESDLLKEEKQTYIYKEPIEITLKSNRNYKSTIEVVTEDETLIATINDNSQTEIEIKANQEQKVILKIEEIQQIENNPIEPIEEIFEEPVMMVDLDEEEPVMMVLEEELPEELPTPTPEVTPVPTEAPTEAPTALPTLSPTEIPTIEPTEIPEVQPTPTPEEGQVSPTPEVTIEPSITPTIEPTIEPTPVPTPEPVKTGKVTVVWKLWDEEGNVVEELSADFKVLEQVEESTETPIIEIEATMDKDENGLPIYSKEDWIQLNLTSDIDTVIELNSSLFKQNTRYCLSDEWITLSKEDSIQIALTQDTAQPLFIDLSEIESEWLDDTTSVDIYFQGNKINQIELNQSISQDLSFEVVDIKTGIINNQPVTFTTNKDAVEIILKHKENGQYQILSLEDYFVLEIEDNLNYSLSIKEDTKVPQGNYRIILKYPINQESVDEKSITFFVTKNEGGTDA